MPGQRRKVSRKDAAASIRSALGPDPDAALRRFRQISIEDVLRVTACAEKRARHDADRPAAPVVIALWTAIVAAGTPPPHGRGECRLPLGELAELIGVSLRVARRALRLLEDAKLVATRVVCRNIREIIPESTLAAGAVAGDLTYGSNGSGAVAGDRTCSPGAVAGDLTYPSGAVAGDLTARTPNIPQDANGTRVSGEIGEPVKGLHQKREKRASEETGARALDPIPQRAEVHHVVREMLVGAGMEPFIVERIGFDLEVRDVEAMLEELRVARVPVGESRARRLTSSIRRWREKRGLPALVPGMGPR